MIGNGIPNPLMLSGVEGGDPLDELGAIDRSLRFRGSNNAFISRTPLSSGNAKKFGIRLCLKRGKLGTAQGIYSAQSDVSNRFGIAFTSDDKIIVYQLTAGSPTINLTSVPLFRDTSAHYDINFRCDTDTIGIVIEVNGVAIQLTGTQPSAGSVTFVNQANLSHYLAYYPGYIATTLDGHVSFFSFVDGDAPAASAYGGFHPVTGQWRPKSKAEIKAVVDAGGINSSLLTFEDTTSTATLCSDVSIKGNNWSPAGISLTAGATYDSMLDTPTNNFPVLNAVHKTDPAGSVPTNGNLDFQWSHGASAVQRIGASFCSGLAYYFEIRVESQTITPAANGTTLYAGFLAGSNTINLLNVATSGTLTSLLIQHNGSTVSSAAHISDGGTLGVAVASNGDISFYVNNVLRYTSTLLGVMPDTVLIGAGTYSSGVLRVNFGQRPFTYTPPNGFGTLCTKNLSSPSIRNPSLHFQTKLATGANIKSTAESVFPSNFFEWIKDRANTNDHQLIDIVRGSNAVLQSNTTNAETTYSTPSGSSVALVWKAGGVAASNTSGTITSQVSANRDAGFSVVTYTGNGASSSIGHGLQKSPSMIIIKSRILSGASYHWAMYHSGIGATKTIKLSAVDAETVSSIWQNAQPTSSVFYIGDSTFPQVNTNNEQYVAYCFAELDGFSKFGKYSGVGSSTAPVDGTFVHLGFKPEFIMVKKASGTGNWNLWDNSRGTENPINNTLFPNTNGLEAGSGGIVDFLSNGFKFRYAASDFCFGGETYIYAAFAKNPFRYANAR